MTVRTEGARPSAIPRATPAKATASMATTGRTPSFLCAIPVTALVPIPPPAVAVPHLDVPGQAIRTALRDPLDRAGEMPPGLPPPRVRIVVVRVRRRRVLPDLHGPVTRAVTQESHEVLARTDRRREELPAGSPTWLDPDQLGLCEDTTRRQRIRQRLEERDPEGAAEERLPVDRAVLDPMGARIEVEWRRTTIAGPGIGIRGWPAATDEAHAEHD